ncbi:thioesterase family protein [Streptomyces lincolnensis]|uniref:acyl-CoA thioesterase n=1 Tax=Streptomyces lincolnensis TaxID=1915 RepID=UPI001E6208A2|nr:acyl-CoA thioesterase domain-containing protein [Streptomyces lincolnensis]MCD7442690.1 thioesterase family protein [Streptomyces lincolnensis]
MEPTQGDESSTGTTVNDEALVDRLRLEATGQDTYTGFPARGFDQRVFGGHLLAQTLLAAAHTVDACRVANSLHAFFLRPGTPHAPIRYSVSPLRDGRSLSLRSITAEQDGRTLLRAHVSFSVTREDEDSLHAPPMPCVPVPSSLTPLHARTAANGHLPDGFNWRTRKDWWTSSRPLDVRYIDGTHLEDPALRCFWFRTAPTPRGDRNTQRAILSFASDRSLLPVIHHTRGELTGHGHRTVASVDHTMWFHSDVNAGDWLLYVQDSPYSTAGTGLARGLIYRADGVPAATVVQQGIVPGSRSRAQA